MEPWAQLAVFRTSGETDVAHVAAALEMTSGEDVTSVSGPAGFGTGQPWVLSSAGRVPSRSLRAHADWLLGAIAGREAAIARLRAEDYWVCASFHYLWPDAPDEAEAEAIDAELERLDITFDLELERDDFP